MAEVTSRLVCAAIVLLALAGCGGGSGSSSGNDSGLPVDSPPPPDSPVGNAAPTISGAPATVVAVGKAYDFTPQASDADGDVLEFAVSNLPRWARFDRHTGRLSGVPRQSDVDKYAAITISVSDGKANAALPAFAISVRKKLSGVATLKWKAPKRNEDGTKLKNLAGFRIYYGQRSSNLASHVEVPEPHIKTATIEDLAEGTWYFAVAAYTTSGMESSLSTIVSKTID